MSSTPGPNDIGYFLSGGSANQNGNLSTGGAISTHKILQKGFNNLWTDISERQARYGFKDVRLIYIKNLNPTLTLKNARAYWKVSDNFTTMQISLLPPNQAEPKPPGDPQPTAVEISPEYWPFIAPAAATFRIISPFGFEKAVTSHQLGSTPVVRRRAVGVNQTLSPLHNQAIAKIGFQLRRIGQGQGNVDCKIWDDSGNVKATIGSVAASSIPDTPSSQSDTSLIFFTNETNQYKMTTGNYIGLEYANGDADNHITIGEWEWGGEIAGNESNSVFDKPGTNEYHWDEENEEWINSEEGKSELNYQAEVVGGNCAGGSPPPTPPPDPCQPPPSPPPNPPPNPPPPNPDPPPQPPPPPDPDPELPPIDPGNKRKPQAYNDGIILPELGPNHYKGLWLERIFAPRTPHSDQVEQSILVEVDEDDKPPPAPPGPGEPGCPNPPPPPPPGPPDPPLPDPECPPGQHWDPSRMECVDDSIPPPTPPPEPPPGGGFTKDGIPLPPLPSTSYAYEDFNYNWQSDHKSNGSFRENWDRNDFIIKRDLNSCIVGGYVKTGGPNDEISPKLGGGKHSDSDNGKAGRCYIAGLNLDGSRIRIRKENPHPDTFSTGVENSLSLGNLRGRYCGVIMIKVNVVVGGRETVRIQQFVDLAGMSTSGVFTPSAQRWTKTLDEIDPSGGWDPGGVWLTTATPGDSKATIRTDEQDDGSYDFKLGFCARIRGGPAY